MTTLELVSSRSSKFTAEDYLDVKPSVIPWLVKGVLPAHGVGFLVGQSKAGKSFLGIDIALRIAAGAKVLGKKTRRSSVIYIGAEDPHGCRLRLAAWRSQFRPTTPTPFAFIGQPVNLLEPTEAADLLSEVQAQAMVYREIHDLPLGLIVFDTLSRCLPGVDENNSQDMSRAFTVLTHIANATGALVLVIAHFGKAGEERGIRGWSGMDANSDATLTLERDKDDTNVRTINLAKVKNGRDGDRLSFILKDVDTGLYDDDSESLTSCVVEYINAPPETTRAAKRKAMNPAEQKVYEAIKLETDHGHTQPLPASIEGTKPWQKAVTKGYLTMRLMGSTFDIPGQKEAAFRMRLNRALMGLEAQRRIRCEGDLAWLI